MKNKSLLVLFILIMAVAIFFRLYKLDQIPPGLYPDVAINGVNALDANQTGQYKIFYPDNNGREGMFMDLIAFSFLIFGPSVWAIKIVAAIFGILTVLGVFLLTRQLFKYIILRPVVASPATAGRSNPAELAPVSEQLSSTGLPRRSSLRDSLLAMTSADIIALLTTFFLAISFWHVNFSRLGFRAITVPFCLVWSFYFLFRGIQIALNPPHPSFSKEGVSSLFKGRVARFAIAIARRGGILYFLIAGLFFGLGFNTYIAFRVAPLILAPIFIIDIAKSWSFSKLKKLLGRWIVFIVGTIITVFPLGLYYIQHPADFMGRAGQVSIFATGNPIKTLADSTVKTIGQFVAFGDANWRHNISGAPEIFWPLIPFFIIGFFYAIWQIIKKRGYKDRDWPMLFCFWTLIFWWGVMLIPSIFSNEGLPHALRSIGSIVPSYIFTAIGVWLIIKMSLRACSPKRADEGIPLSNQERLLSAGSPGALRLGITLGVVLLFCVILTGLEFYRYFIYWGQSPEVKNAFTQKFADEANYLNHLSPDIKKYVIVNEGGTPVPYPDGIPMPAQTIIFLTRAKDPNIKITYLKPESLFAEPRCACEQIAADSLNQPVIVLPMADGTEIFNHLKSEIPNGQVESLGEFSVFKINPSY